MMLVTLTTACLKQRDCIRIVSNYFQWITRFPVSSSFLFGKALEAGSGLEKILLSQVMCGLRKRQNVPSLLYYCFSVLEKLLQEIFSCLENFTTAKTFETLPNLVLLLVIDLKKSSKTFQISHMCEFLVYKHEFTYQTL